MPDRYLLLGIIGVDHWNIKLIWRQTLTPPCRIFAGPQEANTSGGLYTSSYNRQIVKVLINACIDLEQGEEGYKQIVDGMQGRKEFARFGLTIHIYSRDEAKQQEREGEHGAFTMYTGENGLMEIEGKRHKICHF